MRKRDVDNLWVMALAIIVIATTAFLGLGRMGFDITSGFTTAYEGVKPSFKGVYTEGYAFEGSSFRGTQMDFDLDDPKLYLPDIEGEMTSIFLPKDITYGSLPNWVPDSRAIALSALTPEVTVYEWDVGDKAYHMEEYDLKWFVSMEAGYDSQGFFDEEGNNQRYHNAEVWFELNTSPNWVFEGADKTYFTVAKIIVDYVYVDGHDKSIIDVSPESAGTAVSLFYMPYGEPINVDEETFKGFKAQDTRLNPELFRNKLYTMIRLDDFGTQAWLENLVSRRYQGDIVTWEFTVKVFVVGEWTLKDQQVTPELTEEGGYGRQVKIVTQGINWDRLWSENDKLIMLLLAVAIGVGLLIILYAFVRGYAEGLGRRGG